MPKKKKPAMPKPRDMAMLAHIQRGGAGAGTHKSPKDYTRKPKHKGKVDYRGNPWESAARDAAAANLALAGVDLESIRAVYGRVIDSGDADALFASLPTDAYETLGSMLRGPVELGVAKFAPLKALDLIEATAGKWRLSKRGRQEWIEMRAAKEALNDRAAATAAKALAEVEQSLRPLGAGPLPEGTLTASELKSWTKANIQAEWKARGYGKVPRTGTKEDLIAKFVDAQNRLGLGTPPAPAPPRERVRVGDVQVETPGRRPAMADAPRPASPMPENVRSSRAAFQQAFGGSPEETETASPATSLSRITVVQGEHAGSRRETRLADFRDLARTSRSRERPSDAIMNHVADARGALIFVLPSGYAQLWIKPRRDHNGQWLGLTEEFVGKQGAGSWRIAFRYFCSWQGTTPDRPPRIVKGALTKKSRLQTPLFLSAFDSDEVKLVRSAFAPSTITPPGPAWKGMSTAAADFGEIE